MFHGDDEKLQRLTVRFQSLRRNFKVLGQHAPLPIAKEKWRICRIKGIVQCTVGTSIFCHSHWIVFIHSKSVRREIKRLQDDREAAIRECQNAENTVRDARDKVKDIQFKLQSRDRVEKQLEAAQKEQKEYLRTLHVSIR